ncbi:6-carboxy-5 6 7 8-tetrahydropterin synthase [termite gut metagenome]|uniref:6-carboxy-5 6 7 8-tetrahydropterin synthase n=1 Tax=termite gut metagenome TaxID=433724 RepID=A0A5J4SDA5_9ZZZZ
MYTIKKRFEISASHSLKLSYASKCENLHGHNWIIEVWCRSEKLNEDGMVIDFSHIQKNIADKLDHKNLNEILPFNPTAENMAEWICDRIPNCYKVMVQESENNIAWCEKDK